MIANEGPQPATGKVPQATRPGALRSPPERPTVLFFSGPIARADIPALCARARDLLEGCDTDPIACDVGPLVDPDAVTVDALARLQLTARRLGLRVRLRRACDELEELLALMGLSDVLPCGPVSGIEPLRQAEEGKQPCRVQEEADPGDPAV